MHDAFWPCSRGDSARVSHGLAIFLLGLASACGTTGSIDDPLAPGTATAAQETVDLAEAAARQLELAAAYRVLAQRRSVFSLTALHEPFGLAPLEATSCGLPAVVTKNGGPSESMQEGEQEFGVLVDPADPDDIARGLLRVLGPRESWVRFHRAGMQRVLSRYTWECTAEGYLGAIEDILQGSAHRGDLAIPEYFANPAPQTGITQSELAAFYFG